MSKNSREGQFVRTRRIEAAIGSGKSSEQIMTDEGISSRTLTRYRARIQKAKTTTYDPLEVGEVWNEVESKLKQVDSDTKALIEEQRSIKARWDEYDQAKKDKKGNTTRPALDYKPHLIAKCLEIRIYCEKTRVALGQDIGIVPKSSLGIGWATPAAIPETTGDNGDLRQKIAALPPEERGRVVARLRETIRQVDVITERKT